MLKLYFCFLREMQAKFMVNLSLWCDGASVIEKGRLALLYISVNVVSLVCLLRNACMTIL